MQDSNLVAYVSRAETEAERCEYSAGGLTPCPNIKNPGRKFCKIHDVAQFDDQRKKERQRMYNLQKWQNRVNELEDHPELKSLRPEIGITRMLLEETLGRCQTATELVMASQRISDLVCRLEKLVVSCHRLEEKTGAVLDKTAALELANRIVRIISETITDPDTLEKIGNELIQAVMQPGTPLLQATNE